MAKSKTLIAAEEKIAALEARLVVATEVYRNQRAHIAELEAQLNARGAQKVAPATTECVVTRFTTRAGVVMEKRRVGNRAVIRPVQAAAH